MAHSERNAPTSPGAPNAEATGTTTEADAETLTPPRMYYVSTVLGEQPWLAGEHILASAGTAWRNPGSNGAGEGFDVYIPENESLFVDSGGFQATCYFGDAYPYTPDRLFEWAVDVGADFVAGMDWACEEAEVLAEAKDDVDADDLAAIPTRIEWTIEQQVEQARVYENGDYPFRFVPVVQGYSVEDYRYCARRLKAAGVARSFMGIGSVCKRDDPDKILEVLEACKDELPRTEFHLFGATRRIWKDRRFWGRFASADTHAWATSHPDGGWPQDNEEKVEAFEHFRGDIQSVQQRIMTQADREAWTGGDDRSDLVELLAAAQEASVIECACGKQLPPYGTKFEPSCRFCENTRLNRDIRLQAELEAAPRPAAARDTEPETTATTLGQFGD